MGGRVDQWKSHSSRWRWVEAGGVAGYSDTIPDFWGATQVSGVIFFLARTPSLPAKTNIPHTQDTPTTLRILDPITTTLRGRRVEVSQVSEGVCLLKDTGRPSHLSSEPTEKRVSWFLKASLSLNMLNTLNDNPPSPQRRDQPVFQRWVYP